jgi:hypothetical protein
MAEITKYQKGNNGSLTGGIVINENNGVKTYTAVIASTSKDYKTLKGAQNFMSKNGYIEVIEEIELNEVVEEQAAAEEIEEVEPTNDAMEAFGNIVTQAVQNGTVLSERKDIAKAMNFGKYPVLTYNLDDDKGGSKARVKKMSNRYGEMLYNCKLFMGSQTKNDGVFYLMTKAAMLKGHYGIEDHLEDAEYANAPIIEKGQEVAILVYSKELQSRFVIITTAGHVDPTYSTATRFTY